MRHRYADMLVVATVTLVLAVSLGVALVRTM